MNNFYNQKSFTDLNDPQKEAVKTLEGPLLVLVWCRYWENKSLNNKNCSFDEHERSSAK